MLQALTLILLFQGLGEAIHQLGGVPVPGAVIGMIMLLVTLFLNDRLIQKIRPTSGVILTNLSLFFIPPAVGLINHGDRFLHEGLLMLIVILVSTFLGIVATGLTIRGLTQFMARRAMKE